MHVTLLNFILGLLIAVALVACGDDSSSSSDSSDPTAPNAPTDLTVTADDEANITITWTDNSGNEDNFHVYIGTGDTVPEEPTESLDADVTEHTFSGLDQDTEYNVWLTAENDVDVTEAITGAATTDRLIEVAQILSTPFNAYVFFTDREPDTGDSDDGEVNPAFYLEANKRVIIRFREAADYDSDNLKILDIDDNVLLGADSTSETVDGSLESDTDINWIEDSSAAEVRFTMTDTLASQIVRYVSSTESERTGFLAAGSAHRLIEIEGVDTGNNYIFTDDNDLLDDSLDPNISVTTDIRYTFKYIDRNQYVSSPIQFQTTGAGTVLLGSDGGGANPGTQEAVSSIGWLDLTDGYGVSFIVNSTLTGAGLAEYECSCDSNLNGDFVID